MWGIISSIFLLVYLGIIYYVGRRGWTTLGKSTTGIYRKLYWFFMGLLLFSFPLIEIGEDYLEALGWTGVASIGWYSMLAVVYIFLLLLLIDIFRLIDKRIGFVPSKIKDHRGTPLVLTFSIFVVVIFILVYGTLNARNPVTIAYEITVNKQVGDLEKLKVVMVSDIHYGEIINEERLLPMLQTIRELKPDLILVAGDIVEGNATGEEAQRLVDVFSQLQARYGIYAVPGNHDRWAREDGSELEKLFELAGVTVLKDDVVKVENSFYLIGRDDPGWGNRSRKDLTDLMKEVDSSLPLILLDHQPIDLDQARENHIDLQLSGHTHVGQIFPSNLVTGQIFELDYGLLKKDGYHLVVSSGYGTWGPPLRIGNNPEVVSVMLNFQQ